MAKRRLKEWQAVITDRLRLDFQMISAVNETPKYSLSLSGFIRGDWETLVVFDNKHEPPHRHVYHRDGSREEHRFIAALPQTFFAAAQKDLQAHAEDYLHDYENER